MKEHCSNAIFSQAKYKLEVKQLGAKNISMKPK
jgi:hypothetical protein